MLSKLFLLGLEIVGPAMFRTYRKKYVSNRGCPAPVCWSKFSTDKTRTNADKRDKEREREREKKERTKMKVFW